MSVVTVETRGEGAAAAWAGALTTDGGARDGTADLWCTYAAVRALRWLGSRLRDPAAATAFLLEHRNADGGFAWQRGLRSDVWATFYCTQALRDLGQPVPRRDSLARWLAELRTDEGGLSMTPGQNADVWSTYYAIRTWVEIVGRVPPRAPELHRWLRALQRPDGGVGWSALAAPADTRAGYYAALARRYLALARADGASFDPRALAGWLQARQLPRGGFTFTEDEGEGCLWATFRAGAALRSLGSGPRDAEAAIRWIHARARPDGGFSRWEGYEVSDVWACFSAVGALAALGRPLGGRARRRTIAFLRSCQIAGSGCTYRLPSAAGDALATAALLLLGTAWRAAGPGAWTDSLQTWLLRAQMPAEGGVMYMPGRGAEVRCTQWGASALAFSGSRRLDGRRLSDWLRSLQNPDGGFGYWEGRGSDVTATAAALELVEEERLERAIDRASARRFVVSCTGDDGVRFAPRGPVTLSSTCQGLRALALAGAREEVARLTQVIRAQESLLGGYSADRRAIPDLLSTYQAVLTLQRLGIPWPRTSVARLLRRLRRGPAHYAWSPLGDRDGGVLAACLGTLLGSAVSTDLALPRLNL